MAVRVLQFLRLNASRLDELRVVGILDHILKEFDSRDAQQGKGSSLSKVVAAGTIRGSGGNEVAAIPPESDRVTATAGSGRSGSGIGAELGAVLLDGPEDARQAAAAAADDDDDRGGFGAARSSDDGAAMGSSWGREEASRYWSDLGGVIIFCRSLFQVGAEGPG